MDDRVPSATAPKPNVVRVDSLPLLSAAIVDLSSCNVFCLDIAKKPRPKGSWSTRMDLTGLSTEQSSVLVLTGVCVKVLKPGLKSFSEDEIKAVESSCGTVYVFELPKLLQSRNGDIAGERMSDFLEPILTNPNIIISGVQVVARLRALACEYAHRLPCLYKTVWGLQEIGKLMGGSEMCTKSSSLKGLRALLQELGLDRELGDERDGLLGEYRPSSASLLQNAAHVALLSVLAYVSEGSAAFAGAERRIELKKMPAWKCQVCGFEQLLEWRQSTQCFEIGCKRKWEFLIADGKASGSILRAVVVSVDIIVALPKRRGKRQRAEEQIRVNRIKPDSRLLLHRREAVQRRRKTRVDHRMVNLIEAGSPPLLRRREQVQRDADIVQQNRDELLKERQVMKEAAAKRAIAAMEASGNAGAGTNSTNDVEATSGSVPSCEAMDST